MGLPGRKGDMGKNTLDLLGQINPINQECLLLQRKNVYPTKNSEKQSGQTSALLNMYSEP